MSESHGKRMRAFVNQVGDNVFGEHRLMVMDGYDDCIVGVAWQFGKPMIVYDRARIIQRLMAEGMTQEEAEEFHHYNQSGAWTGPGTPAFLDKPDDEEVDDGD